MAVAATLRLQHHGCLTTTFRSDVWVSHVSSDPQGDVFVLHAPTDGMDALIRQWDDKAGPLKILDREPSVVVVRGSIPASGLIAQVTDLGVIVNWPAVYSNGWEEFPLVAPNRDLLRQAVDLFSTHGDVVLLGVYEVAHEQLDLTSPRLRTLLGALTRRQLDAILAAAQVGHLGSPRKHPIAEVADATGLAPSTVAEHLRKGTQALLMRVVQAIEEDPALVEAACKPRGRPRL